MNGQKATTADDVVQRSEGTVRAELVGSTALVTLNRPDKLNAVNNQILAGLSAAVDWVEADLAVRAVVVRGEGRAFSAGGDLESLVGIVQDERRLNEFFDNWHLTFSRIESCPLPTIAAVHGVVFAGGLELTQVCDFVVVGDKTVIGDQHANFGLFPAGGSTQRLPRLIGTRQAKWLLMSGDTVGPEDALALGLVNRVVPEGEVLDGALTMAERLASKSPAATAAIKTAVRLGSDLPLAEAIAAERDLAVSHQGSEDAQIGFAAFKNRHVPEFPRRR